MYNVSHYVCQLKMSHSDVLPHIKKTKYMYVLSSQELCIKGSVICYSLLIATLYLRYIDSFVYSTLTISNHRFDSLS